MTRRLAFSRQVQLLNRCVTAKLDLDEVLRESGYTYEDLGYRYNDEPSKSSATYVTTEDLAARKNGIPSVSFFSGAGGFDLGFEAAGFEHLASFEANETFCETLRHNRPSWKVFPEDLSNRDRIDSILRDRLALKAPFEGVFHGGPPCQSFSVAANQRFSKDGGNFKRTGFAHKEYGTLLFDYVHYIRTFRPYAFLIENVPGLMEVDGGNQLSEALKVLAEDGYSIGTPTVLNATSYRVPQDRRRLIVIGCRDAKSVTFPEGTSELMPCYKAFEKPVAGDINHITRLHRAESVLRYMELRHGQREKMGRVDRLDPNVPSKTVIAGGTGGGGRSHLHPDVPRTLSPREAARLQTFPDSYVFTGPPARQLTQVGNAVPPVMAAHLAAHISKSLFMGRPVLMKGNEKTKTTPSLFPSKPATPSVKRSAASA